MLRDLERIMGVADTRGWAPVEVEYGEVFLRVLLPPHDCCAMEHVEVLRSPGDELLRALRKPIGLPSLEEMVRAAAPLKPAEEKVVAITVSDITRPVPYRGEGGIMLPLLAALEAVGVQRRNIRIVVGTGMHRPSTPEERMRMYGEEVVGGGYTFADHDSQDPSGLVHLGRTRRGTDVSVNGVFAGADVKITTGLVESHFMAGASGGRKSICPALMDYRSISVFHGPDILEDGRATNLVLEGNPCHEEALEIARMVGVDFSVNATLDDKLRPTGFFAGNLERAHLAAVENIRRYVAIPVRCPYDVVLTHAGYVGRDHYQTVKAAVNALPIVRRGGTVIVAAHNCDVEPIGSRNYRELLCELKKRGPDGYLGMLRDNRWSFTVDQWEPQMWGKVLRHVGDEGLLYCTTSIPEGDFSFLPGISGYTFLRPEERRRADDLKVVQAMVQNAVRYAVGRVLTGEGRMPSMCYISQGPYAVPYLVG